MYTECPECGTAFRVTAKVLQQARGNVRCGGCSHAFNALEYLSEVMPGSGATEEPDAPVDELAETSRRLLQTLDDLAGPDEVRIEDTGVEWRVLEDIESGIEVDQSDGTDEPRYDDNSPLPDDFDEDVEPVTLADSFDQVDDQAAAAPQPLRRLTDTQVNVEFNEVQGDLALAEPEEWNDLLDEFRDSGPGSLEVEEELAAIHNQLSAGRDNTDTNEIEDPDDVELADIDTQFNAQAEALGLDLTGSENALTDEVPLLPEYLAPTEATADDGASAENDEVVIPGDPQGAAANEYPDDEVATAAEIASSDESLPEQAQSDDFGDDSETGINEALPDDFDDTTDTGIREALSDDFDDATETGIREALSDDFDDTSETGISEAHQDIPDDDSQSLETSSAGIDRETEASEEIDVAAKSQSNEESEAPHHEIENDDEEDPDSAGQGEEIAGDGNDKGLADLIRESTGEFEAQIEVATSAIVAEDDEDQPEFDAEDIVSALDEAETDSEHEIEAEPAGDVDEDADNEVLAAEATDDATESGQFVAPQTDEEMTVNMEIDQELMALATQDDEFSATLVGAKSSDFAFDEKSGEVETIIMEGEDVRSDVEEDRLAAESAARNQLDDPIDLADTYAVSRDKLWGGRRKYDPPGYAHSGGRCFPGCRPGRTVHAQFTRNTRDHRIF